MSEEKCKVVNIKILKKDNIKCIIIMTSIKRNIEKGDKLSGRHGNKGIVAKIINTENMPYTQDGQPIDIIMNPLGIPSRMNLGQVFESMLGLAAHSMKEIYEVKNFYEKSNSKSSTQIVYNKLLEASEKTKKKMDLQSKQSWQNLDI